MRMNFVKNILAFPVILFAGALLSISASAQELSWEETLTGIGTVQKAAEQYLVDNASDQSRSSLMLTFSYLRGERYSDGVWALVNRKTDIDFREYLEQAEPELKVLQGLESMKIPTTGESVDVGHMLASASLAYDGMAVAGGWGGDCMELAQATMQNAASIEENMRLQQQIFASEDEAKSWFSAQDLRADLDATNLAAMLQKNSDLQSCLQSYYEDLTPEKRASTFVQVQFGNADTADSEQFQQTVYQTMIQDEGMQLLLAVENMWDTDTWQPTEAAAPALRAAAYLLADYVADQASKDVKNQTNSQPLPKASNSPAVSSQETVEDGEVEPSVIGVALPMLLAVFGVCLALLLIAFIVIAKK